MKSHQLLIVISSEWTAVQGRMLLYQIQESTWTNADSFPIVLGKNGMAWGIGKHPKQPGGQKQEGDGRSPAGLFALGPAFGHYHPPKMDFLSMTKDTEAVDDPGSRYYNQIVKCGKISQPDWNSSEKMAEIPVYDLGCVVHHNFPQPQVGAGSAIFLHIWTNAETGTAGCTAMARDNLFQLLNWLDKSKNPLLVQLPLSEYLRLQKAWELPECHESSSTASQKRSSSSSVL